MSATPLRSRWAKLRRFGNLRFAAIFGAFAWVVTSVVLSALLLVADREELEIALLLSSLIVFPFCVCTGLWVFWTEERSFRAAIRDQRCTHCDYDLRGTIEAGRDECPECGCLIERLNS